jgi:DNA-binding CsgD family transcriptional regulator
VFKTEIISSQASARAKELGISIETVRMHISHALKKTKTKTRTGLVARGLGR